MNELLTMLDTKYKRLEYIQSTGTQYIDTGIKPTNATTIKTKLISTTKDIFPYGSRTSASSSDKHTWNMSGENRFFPQFASDISAINYVWSTQTIYEIENGQNGAYVNGTKIKNYSEATFNSTLNMYLFGLNANGTLENRTLIGRIYYFQVYEGTTLVCNFIPVLRKSDNEIGMLDLVEGKFYGNAGTGKFTANLDTMYALIQGTPTVQDGRVSNFSGNNYLKLPFDTSKNSWKIIIKITPNYNDDMYWISSNTTFGFTATERRIWLSSNGSSWNLANGLNITGNQLPKTECLAKFEFTGDKYSYDYSIDKGKTWINIAYINSDIKLYNGFTNLKLGQRASSNYLLGSIDLNRSYIKIDDTKYKLQAVVGYSQPSGSSVTITNGIASNFSTSNYLMLSKVYNITNTMNTEIYVRAKTPSNLANNYNFIYSNTSGYPTFFCLSAYSKFLFNCNFGYQNGSISFGDAYITGGVQVNTWYRFKIKGNKGLWKFEIFDDNGNLLNLRTKDWTDNIFNLSYTIKLQCIDYSNTYSGEIDLNNTYIKINNKLWFNGLEA